LKKFRTSAAFSRDEKAKLDKLQANLKKTVYGLLRCLLEITSSEVFKVNVWLSSIEMYHYTYPMAFSKTICQKEIKF